MNKTKIKCPRCNSDKLYKFGLNKQAKQKYQCKRCKRLFALGDGEGSPKMNYPKCGKGTYLHHAYKHYNHYKCNITDRWSAYTQAIATLLPSANHIPVKPMSSDTNNNIIESFNKTFKSQYKAKKGFNSFEKANNLNIFIYISL